ncbi:helix-turn-helix domain-containing protein [Roseibium algae]|uniref:helix-turn-helix domain-containing protein n=1 Tax=Roseibium algae TaxID=3123038 RepID=UPI003BF47DE6
MAPRFLDAFLSHFFLSLEVDGRRHAVARELNVSRMTVYRALEDHPAQPESI